MTQPPAEIAASASAAIAMARDHIKATGKRIAALESDHVALNSEVAALAARVAKLEAAK